jgi:signal transduction histidine kinase
LRAADERKDEFLALLVHELRNPLAPIRTGLVMLGRERGLPDLVQRVQQIIERQTSNVVRITDDLLDVSRFGQGESRTGI